MVYRDGVVFIDGIALGITVYGERFQAGENFKQLQVTQLLLQVMFHQIHQCHLQLLICLHVQLRHLVAFEPIAMPLISMVHSIHEVRCPTRVGFDADELQIRMPLEHTAENERTYDILVASNDRLERIDLWPAIVSQVVLLRR